MQNANRPNPALDALMQLGNASPTPFFYAQGGMVGPGGMPMPMQQPMPMQAGLAPPGQMQPPAMGQMQEGPISYQEIEQQLNQLAAQHPQEVAQISQVVQEALATGQLTAESLNMMVQLATVAAQNPEMYPQMRNFAIQQGIADEQDMPPQYDQGLVFSILLVGKALQGGQSMPGQPIFSMAQGGKVPQSGRNDGSVTINAHEGEYVIPSNVVKMKGKEFFDNLVEKYRDR